MFALFKPYPNVQAMLADYDASIYQTMPIDDPEYSRWRDYFSREEI